MFTFLVILTVLVFIALLLVSGIKVGHSLYSIPELKRRAKRSKEGKAELEREKLLPGVEALITIKGAVLLVLTEVLLIVTFGWTLGIILGIVVAIFYIPLSRTRKISRAANGVYAKLEPKTLRLVGKFPGTFAFISDNTPVEERAVNSKEEFTELIERSGTALTDIERKVIANALTFNDKPVSSIMTPKSVIDFINKGEFLGPLVLDELHALGHSRLPVIDGDLDHVVGILYLRDLLSLDVKHSATAEKVMDTHVYYIREDQTLEHALAAFLKNRHHILIVINKQRETVGLLTIEDTIEALLGRQIVDEDDNHADLRSVAEHESRHNNTPAGHTDV
ncbi:MAG: CBS domain-containing protein [Candidatus Microsaccharimonas sp.]